ncbi:DEAD/DEAH box helicase [Mucilaginibacter gossypii]|uniref:Predicted helicase n=1 Tax=Mucilaginibacter gossypii TaxID=551996 RepID=A0A1G8B6X3_9SPHI|nr:type ISP restriction/modification enzyme [Mucilaginibacter gossypii]SDH28753.1 Predicted helicase [Mucilaginibacter gossypii]
MTSFNQILDKYRKVSFSERDKGDRFERLMQAYLLTDPRFAYRFKRVWLWTEFFGRNDLGGGDTGIDLVAMTNEGDFWAIQCKCYQEGTAIDKPAVDGFLSTSGRRFKNAELQTVGFSHRMWIDTTGKKWGSNAEEAIRNQHPAVTRLNLFELQQAPVNWEKLENGIHGEVSRTAKKTLRPHQKEALEKTHAHFQSADRGKLIMACGTGKTFNSLKIAENETDGKGLILFLVPSIALLGQTLREWSSDAGEPINAICICSDAQIARQKAKTEDTNDTSTVDLALPASTDIKSIVKQFENIKASGHPGMTVVFSTYQSIQVIAEAQAALLAADPDFGPFDLIVCDEAHRTTGVSIAGTDESAFTKVHNNDFIKAKKRLYMTATPRIYSADSKSKAAQADAPICSMDDPALYGEEIYRIGFGAAVASGLLTDYKVLILTLSEGDVPPAVQKMIMDENSEINADDASKLIGCVNALSKQMLGDEGILAATDPEPMRRAVAFCQNIAASKKITSSYNDVTATYVEALPLEKREQMVQVSSRHIDGTMAAPEREELLSWLKSEPEDQQCRVLTNVRCLSEGVDVPSLDAVMFLSARNSEVDVVQSVGRVMRLAPGKKYGYIIIPIVIPSDIEPDKALDDNDRYKVVWTVLNALRAHDDRFNATVNKIELNKKQPKQILVGRPEFTFGEDGAMPVAGEGGSLAAAAQEAMNRQLAIQFEQLQHVIFAKMVQKVGDRRYWEQWAKSVAEIAERQVKRITLLISQEGVHRDGFERFLEGLRKNINPSITELESIEMLAQHIITRPVFDALFEGYSFVQNNPISQSMQGMLDLIEAQTIDGDYETLHKFYESVRMRAADIDNAEGKQKIIVELYDKFFKTAFPKLVEKLGIVYTPIDVVDFIIHSVNDVLMKEFGQSLSDENVHILDPFTGTGTFITRLLQSGLIDKKDLPRKYQSEIFANELVLLAYYIAAVNIENVYHDVMEATDYQSFEGICLTDTFQLGETDGNERLFSEMFSQNSERVERQRSAPLRVIFGNPPYSVGQKSENDNAKNQVYERLDQRIADTYVSQSTTSMNKALYDAYIKAFRWATDRLGKDGGIICFVSNGSWLDGNATSGFRKSIEREFSNIYVFDLRGNQRTSGELSRREGGKIFGSGSRTPITITLLIKKTGSGVENAKINYHDIGDYLSREEKLHKIKSFKSILYGNLKWQSLIPNNEGDWINHRNEGFEQYIPVAGKDKNLETYFNINSNGVVTNRDAWVYSFSRLSLEQNMSRSIQFYNNEVERFVDASKQAKEIVIEDFLNSDPSQISWSRAVKQALKSGKRRAFAQNSIIVGLYRPFVKEYLYFNRDFNECVYQQPAILPSQGLVNKVIAVSGVGSSKEFSVLISDTIINLDAVEKAQCFPLYYYEKSNHHSPGLFDTGDKEEFIRRDAISDFILDRAKSIYGKTINKEDIFYYVYGIFHNPNYRHTFSNDLKKLMPRIPLIEDVRDFWKFSKAGRELAELHINYEKVLPYDGVVVKGRETGHFTVNKMKFPKKNEKDCIIYNPYISVENIPAKAYGYTVNGKSAIEWIMERYQVTTHKESGIVNDPNDWAAEVGKPAYILDLLLSIITLSVRTVEIVEGLPKLDFSTL